MLGMTVSRLSRRATLAGLASTAALPTMAATTDLQQMAADLRGKFRVPGLVLATGMRDAVEIAPAGILAKGAEVPVTRDHLWHIGSITKSMTATLVARLAAAGQLHLSDTVRQHLTGVIDTHPGYADITLRALLDHRGGLPPHIDLPTAQSLVGTYQTRQDIRADRAAYAANAAANPPNPQITYSNAGYVLAGLICETVTDTPWETLLREEVFTPLGITSAGFGPPGLAAPESQPWGHGVTFMGRYRAMPPGPAADNVPALGPAGTVHIGPADLIRYLQAHAARDEAFLPAPYWEALHEPVAGADYACGWVVEGDIRHHNGSNTMWYAVAGFDRMTGQTAAILTNSGAYRRLYQPGQDALMALLQTR
ncbi:serine hydrolase [Actibacterium sp. 188UL27-1]|uniref:serine hydrolase domain-containing protein n=1 Tax=Actibacterium sp. 188UL27-1 TaxID=2786961 RepID=UPI00195914DC|nr:serine hydrolase domain-containing protein [Actibacterium sp. 188UL27-1]MBM7066101.1 beta-lactamase family protein [Actibacterium sp. 188UL27-1]